MDNSQYTPRTLIPPIDRILVDNMKQSVGVTSGYNDTNPDLTKPGGKIISGSDGKVININSQGVATYYPTSDVYDQTSGERGIPGSGNFSVDKKSIPHMSYLINPSVMGYDENSKLYLNGKIRQGQSQGDEASNMFAGVKTPSNFDYKGCSALPSINSGSSSRELIITDASYGLNCGNASGNRTQLVQDYITKHPDYSTYNIGRNVMDFGDPFFGCNKQMSVTYKCNGNTNTIVRADGKFDTGASLDLTCNPQSTPDSLPNKYLLDNNASDLTILDASYGSNCGNATGNRTQIVQDYISQNPSKTTYNIGQKTVGLGDPFFGCNKNMAITYKCNGKTQTVTRTDGQFDSGASLDITCIPESRTSLTKCYYDALAKGLSYFGLGNVDSNTNLGTCYAGNSDILNNWWQNPGIPIWKIDMRKDLNYGGNDLSCIFVGQNSNLYFSLDGIHTNDDYNFYTLCKLGKLPNCDPSNANVFIAEWNALNCLFLANGNMYIFRFPQEGPVPTDLRENPENYFQHLVYSSGTQGQTLNVGWNEKDISSGVSGRAGGNMLVSSNNGYDPLMVGESMYSLDGKLKLTLHEDYSLVLYTGDPNAVGCKSDMANNTLGYGAIAVNQVNNLNTNGEENFGKLAYVNRLGTAFEYTDPSLFHYSDTYTSNPGYSINNIDSNKNATKYNDPIGFDYDNTSISIDRCQMQCSKSGACVGTVIDNGNCYLLDAINNDDVVYKDAVKESGYTKYPHYTRPGYDIGGTGFPTPQVEDCMKGCNEREDCGGFEYWDWTGNCWLKSYEGAKWKYQTDENGDFYVKRSGESNEPIITLRVPEINKEGQPSYSVYPNNSLSGGDLGTTTAYSANECLDICNKTEGCNSVEFNKGGSDYGYCYPKSYKEPTTLSPYDNSDVYIRNPEKIENPMETTYTEYPHHWINGYDVGTNYGATPQVKDCMAACNEKEECAGFEYWDWNGYCFLKSKDGIPHMAQTDGGNAIYVKNPAPAGTSYLIPTNVNVVNPNKFANYNISGSPMTNTTHDVSLMPESITNNFLLTSSQLKEPNDKIVRETDRIIRESFTSTQMYQENDKYLSKLDDTLNNYMDRNNKLQPNIITLNKMVSNSSIQMRYLNIVYSILFIIVCILLVVAFTISL